MLSEGQAIPVLPLVLSWLSSTFSTQSSTWCTILLTQVLYSDSFVLVHMKISMQNVAIFAGRVTVHSRPGDFLVPIFTNYVFIGSRIMSPKLEANAKIIGEPLFRITASATRARCSTNQAMVYIKHGINIHVEWYIHTALPLLQLKLVGFPNWGIFFVPRCSIKNGGLAASTSRHNQVKTAWIWY